MYTEDDMLMLSGIQHIVFCPRQWALIHLEEEWQENALTIEGQILHNRVDNPYLNTKEDNKIIYRAHRLASYQLGLTGIADVIEWEPVENGGITLPKKQGIWLPHPVEYKHGSSKQNDCDRIQLTAQVICLEEMYHIQIDQAFLFYARTRRRELVDINEDLRKQTFNYAELMHNIYDSQKLPEPQLTAACKSCSLNSICTPRASRNVKSYLKQVLNA